MTGDDLREWADLHGYTGHVCTVCGWSGVTDSGACEECDGGEQHEDDAEDEIDRAYQAGLDLHPPVPGWSQSESEAYREGIRHARDERLEAQRGDR